jgi:hypothetical protein
MMQCRTADVERRHDCELRFSCCETAMLSTTHYENNFARFSLRVRNASLVSPPISPFFIFNCRWCNCWPPVGIPTLIGTEVRDVCTGLDRSLGFQEFLAPRICRQSAHEGGKVVSPTHRPPLPPREDTWYSFLLEAESTPGPQCGRKDEVNEKFQ